MSNERLYFFLSFFTEHDCQGESYVSFYIQLISQRSLNIRQITNQNVSFLQQEFEIENEPQGSFFQGGKSTENAIGFFLSEPKRLRFCVCIML